METTKQILHWIHKAKERDIKAYCYREAPSHKQNKRGRKEQIIY